MAQDGVRGNTRRDTVEAGLAKQVLKGREPIGRRKLKKKGLERE